MNPSGGGSGGGSKWVKTTPSGQTQQQTPPPQIGKKSGGTQQPPQQQPSGWVKAKPSPGVVTGATGKPLLARNAIGPLNQATSPGQQPPTGVKPCPLKTHWVKALLHFKDDDTPVPATAGKILKGDGEVHAGPLGGGFLEARDLEPGSYEVTFPDIDAQEWDVA